jgi:hypothetical protein
LDVDIHIIPDNPIKSQPEHWHIDFAYLLKPLEQVTPTDPELSRWFKFDEIENIRIRKSLNGLKI